MSALRVVVAVKYVPDIQSARAFSEGRLVRTAEDGTLNELDENAVEAALRLVEALGEEDRAASEVIAVSVGPDGAEAALRKAFQLGVDRAVRVTDDALAGSDYTGTAAALAGAVARLHAERPVDLVLTGMAALDGLGSVVPAMTGAALGWPAVGLVTALTLEAREAGLELHATRELDGASEQVEVAAPAVVSVTDHANDPRFPNFKLIMAARTKTVDVWTAAEVAAALDEVTAGRGGVPGAASAADVLGADGARSRVLVAEPRPPRPETVVIVDKGSGGTELAEYLIAHELV